MIETGKDLLEVYQNFAKMLNEIDFENLTKEMTLEEVERLRNELQKNKIPDINAKLLVKVNTLREKPANPNVVCENYPVIDNFWFLSESHMRKLDKFLGMHTVGQTVFHFSIVTHNPKLSDKIRQELIKEGILEERYALICNNCYEMNVSSYMNSEAKIVVEKLIAEYKETGSYNLVEQLEKYLFNNCHNCTECFDFNKLVDIRWKKVTVLIKEKVKKGVVL